MPLKRVLVVSLAVVASSMGLAGQGSGVQGRALDEFLRHQQGAGRRRQPGRDRGSRLSLPAARRGGGQPADVLRLPRATRPANGTTTLHGKDRIGKGPFYNSKGVMMAKDVADLHGAAGGFSKESALTEKGEMVERHDILTGSKPDGTRLYRRHGSHLQRIHEQPGHRLGAAWPFGSEQRLVVDFRASEQGLQPGEPGQHRRRRAVLLLRDRLATLTR